VSISKEWLRQKTSVAELEAGFARQPPADRWLKGWQELVAAMQPGDELWEYCSPPPSWQKLAGEAGYAVVRGGRVVDNIITLMN
jgi:hypothetical protein